MRVISHRGNVSGTNSKCERKFVEHAISCGYDVEIDVWFDKGVLLVGHDEPLYELPKKWLEAPVATRLWYHAKDSLAMTKLSSLNVRTFIHDSELFALVFPDNLRWIHPNHNVVSNNCIILDIAGYTRVTKGSLVDVLPFAVCTDWCDEWREWVEHETHSV